MWTCVHKSICDGWPNGLANRRKLNASSKKAISVQPCIGALVLRSQLASTCVGWPNGEKLAFTCVQIWARSKWTQVMAYTRKSWPNGVEVYASFQLPINCDYVWPGVYTLTMSSLECWSCSSFSASLFSTTVAFCSGRAVAGCWRLFSEGSLRKDSMPP